MPKYTLNRAHVLASRLGATVEFEANVPTFAPAFLEKEILALGGERVEDDEGVADTRVDDKTPATEAERRAALLVAFEAIVNTAAKADFTEGGKGHPTQKALTRELGWTPVAADRDAVWAEFVKGKKA